MKNLHKKFSPSSAGSARIPVLYELLPPPRSEIDKALSPFLHAIDKLLENVHIDAFNIPEIHGEMGQTKEKGARTVPKGDPREFGQVLLRHRPDVPVIINHVVVHDPVEQLSAWMEETHQTYNVSNVVFVGGESNTIHYPGPTVRQATEWVRDHFNEGKQAEEQMLVGGITIATRRHQNPEADEPLRLINKGRSGTSFFTSQIIYEAEAMKKLLTDYDALCIKSNVEPKRIFISFAPASTVKDIQFLRWLGVSIPPDVEARLVEGWIGMGWRSLDICIGILSDILSYCRTNSLRVPLGLNVEHVMKYNFELSKELLMKLSELL